MAFRRIIPSVRGFTLIELLVAVALLGGLILTAAQVATSQFRTAAALEQRLEILNLKSTLLASLDCAQTLPANIATGCSAAYLDIVNGVGNVIIAGNGAAGTPYGKLLVRAHCVPGHLSIEVRPSREISMGRTTEWLPLFASGLEPCRGNFVPLIGGGGSGTAVCEDISEMRYDACIGNGKKERKCDRKERRAYRRCSRWSTGA